MNKYLLMALLSGLVLPAFSRGYYEIKFYDNDQGVRTSYTGLLMFYDDSSHLNKLRVIFDDDNGKPILVEESITVAFARDRGIDYRVLQGSGATILRSDDDQTAKYFADTFLFRKSSDGYFLPDQVQSTNDYHGKVRGVITSFRPLNGLSEKYLRKFDWKIDPAFTPHYDSIVTAASHLPRPKTVHLFLLSDTSDEKLGQSCSRNENQLISFFKSASKVSGIRLDIVRLAGTDFTRTTLEDHLNRLSVSQNDGVIFYYSGHGFRLTAETDSFPIIDLRGNKEVDAITKDNTQYLKDIYDRLKSKNPRFVVAIGECCNQDEDIELARNESTKNDIPVMLAPTRMPLNKVLVNQLFNFNGYLLVASARPHQYSYYHKTDGGFFWNNLQDAFLDKLCVTNINADISWLGIIQTAANNTNIAVSYINKDYNEMAVWYYPLLMP